jgi:hypothetical protein
MQRLIYVLAAAVALAFAKDTYGKPPLDERFILGPIRVFYTKDGTSAVPLVDADSNSVPDHVEDVAKQVWATHQLFCDVLEFPDPFKSERYSGVTCVEVRIWDRAEIGGGNGVAFESPQRAREIPQGKPSDRALVMSIGKHVDARKNITPSHEFFHLIQYSVTYFKNPWYLEGLARWAEHGLQLDGVGQSKYPSRGPFPQRDQDLAVLFGMSYDAEFVLWNPIASRVDRKGVIPRDRIPEQLRSLRYSDGTPVLRDQALNGAPLMREILVELGKLDDVAFMEQGYKEWSEESQLSPNNNPYIYQGIMDALRRHSSPVGAFPANKRSR